ncbi:MAG: 2-C-methyl-D-erythritol 4-phosphate cytidylyltransferase [Gammaproteobacteria bacterium]|nr:2-C-methyl-D-erythritol 4-phosphate cytidylyltransferase [Gammaproteobacteria bacterium]MDE2346440.1 2-C-methyl-D-erythritol 4-phosphate cytidylyltransferase [Gammaproteobacteria bacterium]
MRTALRHWAVIPAAGSGARMGGSVPKQYLPLAGKTVIEHALNVFLSEPRIAGISVAIADADTHWKFISPHIGGKAVRTVKGGEQRAQSVLNILHSLETELMRHDWVLVHDAVRPCLRSADLKHLLEALDQDEIGGILATPLVDALISMETSSETNSIPVTGHLWRAFTPQMFRFGLLVDALEAAIRRGENPRDEASAVQNAGHRVRLVEGRADNIKITRPGDLKMAQAILDYSADTPP